VRRRDPIDLLRRLNPAARERYRDEDDAVLATILDGRPTEARDDLRDRRRLRHLVAAGLAVSAVTATAAWVVLHEEPVTNPLQVACHATADLGGDRTGVAEAGDPVAACSAVWATGVFGPGPVPELTACTTASGTAAVFPGGPDVCARLGLAAVSSMEIEVDAVHRLDARLRVELGSRCVGRDEAVRIVEKIFAELRLDDWAIELSGPFSAGRPCTASGVDPERRTVSIGGIPTNALAPSAPAAP
jgi:AcrR family transcriptional regulator